MAQYTVKCTDGSVRQLAAHRESQVGDRMLFRLGDENEPVCELASDSVMEVRRRIMESNGMWRKVKARIAVETECRAR
jgi:hypothetical protein